MQKYTGIMILTCAILLFSADNLSEISSQVSVDDRDADGVSVADVNLSNVDTPPKSITPFIQQSSDLKPPSCRRDEVAEGSETTSSDQSSEEPPCPCQLPHYHLSTPELTSSHSMEQHQHKLVAPKPQPTSNKAGDCDSHRMERKHHQHKRCSQMEFPILQHLRDNHRQPSISSPYAYPPTDGATGQHTPGGSSSVLEKRDKDNEEVFV